MPRKTTPLDLWKAGYEMWWLAAESQAVMTMRILGMGKVWSVDRRENARMVLEKPEAFGKAAMAATLAAATGQRSDQILRAAAKPLRRKTKANARRLAKRGPDLGRN